MEQEVKYAILILLLLLALSLQAQSPRSCLTGQAIDGAHAGQAIAVTVTPNPQIWLSDEATPDKQLKWKSWIPITVWRQRKIAGQYRQCPAVTFQFEFVPSTLAQDLRPQSFIIPANLVKEFDHFSFEYRSWYSISTSLSKTGSELAQATSDLKLAPLNSLAVWFGPNNCSDDPRVVTHVLMRKE